MAEADESQLDRIEDLLKAVLSETRAKREKPKRRRCLKSAKGEVSEADLVAADARLNQAGIYRRTG